MFILKQIIPTKALLIMKLVSIHFQYRFFHYLRFHSFGVSNRSWVNFNSVSFSIKWVYFEYFSAKKKPFESTKFPFSIFAKINEVVCLQWLSKFDSSRLADSYWNENCYIDYYKYLQISNRNGFIIIYEFHPDFFKYTSWLISDNLNISLVCIFLVTRTKVYIESDIFFSCRYFLLFP